MSQEKDEDDVVRPPTPPVQLDYRTKEPRHKPISFVAAQSSDHDTQTVSNRAAISDDYLALVLNSKATKSQDAQQNQLPSTVVENNATTTVCAICNLPLTTAQQKQHHTSTAHQLSLQHTHVPSSIDRARKGLQYLQSYGFDPDARTGLGSLDRPGTLHPIKQKEKVDRSGVGALPRTKREQETNKEKKMGAKEIRKAQRTERRRNERLHRLIYSNGEVEKYLGEDA